MMETSYNPLVAETFPQHDDRLAGHYRGTPVCVTGGAGFIGSHLVDALVEIGAEVSVIDDLSSGRRENLARSIEKVRFVHASILDRAALDEAATDCRIIFHQAALASVPLSVEQPELFHEVNGTGALRVLEGARRAGSERVIYASSSSVYGDGPALPKVESMNPQPQSPYAVSKLAGEYWLKAFCECYGLAGASLRYFNVFGPRQRADSAYAAVVPAFISAMLAKEQPRIFGDGTQSRDFTYVENVVLANLLAGASAKGLRCPGAVMNIGAGERYTLLELIDLLQRILHAKPRPVHLAPRAGDVKHSQADISAARDLINYEPVVGFKEGLRRTVQWFRQ